MKKTVVIINLLVLTLLCSARALNDPWYKDIYWLWNSNEEIAFKAISRNDYPTFYRMICEKEVDVNTVNDRGESLLCRTASEERLEMFLLLLEKGADGRKYKNNRNTGNDSTLYWAAFRGRMDMCELLLKAGVDPDQLSEGNKTALIAAVENGDYALAEMLLKAGADPNYKSGWGPVLHVACRRYNPEVIKLLLRYGAKVNTLHEGSSALAEAVNRFRDFQFNAIVKAEILLAAGADVNLCKPSPFQDTFPLHLAVLTGNTELAELLIAHGADVNKEIIVPFNMSARLQNIKGQKVEKPIVTPLSAAVKNGYLPMVKLLLKHGARATAKRLEEIKKLKPPGKPETLDLFKVLYGQFGYKHSRYELVKRMIAAGADINALNSTRQSLLEKVAADRGAVDLMKLLLKHEAKHKNYALSNAVASGCIANVKLLLEHGAKPNVVSKLSLWRPTPVFHLSKNAVVILPLLMKAGADINQKNYQGQNLLAVDCYAHRDTLIYKSLIAAGADCRNLDKHGRSAAETIISDDNTGRCSGEIRILLDQGADRKKIRQAAEKHDRENLLFLLDKVWGKK